MSDAVHEAQQQMAVWLGQGLDAAEAWFALTGQRREHVSWAEVRGFMIGWWLRYEAAQQQQRVA